VMAMSSSPVSIVIAGVGGQGTVLMANVIAKAAINAGYDVKGMNTYGAAQRGGPVSSQIRIGNNVLSPRIGLREADVIVALEPAEALRASNTLRIGGRVLVNTEKVYPVEVLSGRAEYPSLAVVLNPLKKISGTFVKFNATKIAESAGSPITLNMVMLGSLAAFDVLQFSNDYLTSILEEELPKSVIDVNLKAFRLGYNFVSKKKVKCH